MMFLYLSLAGDNRLACYQIDDDSGDLKHLRNESVAGAPSVQGRHCSMPILYVAMRSNGQLLSFRVDASDGCLTLLQTIDTKLEDPGYFLTDKTGRFLITPYYASGKVTVYSIGEDGAAKQPAVCIAKTDLHAHGLAIDMNNRFVFVPHTCPGDAIFQFELIDGILKPNDPPTVSAGKNLGPRHVHFHPNGRWLYADNEQDNSVTLFLFDSNNGTLCPQQTLTTLPQGFSGGACARMLIHPSGQMLYAANRGHDSLACFLIDQKTGELTPAGHFSTPPNPRSFDIDPSGKNLYVAGQSADCLTQFRIDSETGSLEEVKSYETGSMPWWVHVMNPVANL